MSKCINIAPTKVCFFPSDNSSSVEILHHTIYENGVSIGQAFTTLEDTETTLDLSTYLGGGVIGKCNQLKLYEREVCATIDGVSQKYELIRIYTRDPITGAMTIIGYEDTFGNPITGVVVETCCDCSAICYGSVIAPIANRRSDSYGPLMAQYQTWINDAQYDSIYAGRGPVGAPRAHYYRVKVYNASNTLLSTTVLGGYLVDVSNATYLQFLNDLSALTNGVGVTFIGPTANVGGRGGYQIEYDNTVGFSIILEHGIDNHAGGVIRNPDIKQAIRYEGSRSEVRDSIITSGDLNNPAADAGGREWTSMAGVFPNNNVTII